MASAAPTAADTATAATATATATASKPLARPRSKSRVWEDPPEFQLSSDDVRRKLAEFSVYLAERTSHHLGYPYNLQFDTAALVPFLQYSINNLGDPFVESNYGVHSRTFEVDVLNFFADLWRIPRDEYWGYTTTCGTEGNQLGILYGREKLPEGILYCSKDTHYSVPKAAHMYRIPLVLVESTKTGEMDYEDFRKKLTANKDKPAIVNFNAGTTVKGAVDCVDKVLEIITACGFTRDQYYVHCDGALAGLIIPLVEGCDVAYDVSFEKGIDSISVSGHKMLGCPMPCGVVLTRKEHMQRFRKDVEYLNSVDTTIMGSRNGQAPVAMWYALQNKGVEGLRSDVKMCIRNANYLKQLLLDNGITAHLNPLSTTVVFTRPPPHIVAKWQLACTGEIAHIVVMPSSNSSKLEAFVREYATHLKKVADDDDAKTAAAAAATAATTTAAVAAAATEPAAEQTELESKAK